MRITGAQGSHLPASTTNKAGKLSLVLAGTRPLANLYECFGLRLRLPRNNDCNGSNRWLFFYCIAIQGLPVDECLAIRTIHFESVGTKKLRAGGFETSSPYELPD
jgi:hypothetical protein